MKLTEHFTSEEMEYSSTGLRLGLDNTCPSGLQSNMMDCAIHLEMIRRNFNAPLRVTSCYRSAAVNKAVGGSKTSAHSSAHAVDCRVDGVTVLVLCIWCSKNLKDFDQIIYEFGPTGWMHIGFTTGTPRKQLLTATKVDGKTVYKMGIGV